LNLLLVAVSKTTPNATIAELKKAIAVLTAGLHKVSAQLELNKPAPQLIENNQ